jgi:hypothetical protein
MMSLLQVINQIVGAIHSDTSKHITFWDIRRAFNFIPRHLQKLAWMRMGVSKEVAEWFIEQRMMDIDSAKTIEKYAREAQLWPHEETVGAREDQVLRDIKFYLIDGSFTVKTTGANDIITSQQTLRDAGEGTIGIVLMPRNLATKSWVSSLRATNPNQT